VKTVSVIIPAYNDARRLERTLQRLRQIREQEYSALEIVVAVRPSSDDTLAVAQAGADQVVEGGPVSVARNRGAAVARGEIFIFLDADARPSFGTIPAVVAAVAPDTVGSCSAYPSSGTAVARWSVGVHNLARATGVVKGMANLMFCHRSLVRERGVWFNEAMQLGEHRDFFSRALKSGARYRYLRLPRGYEVDVARYETNGYWQTGLFWAYWTARTKFFPGNQQSLQDLYWSRSVTASGGQTAPVVRTLWRDAGLVWSDFQQRRPRLAALLHFPVSLSGLTIGVVFLAAAMAGPRRFLLMLFAKELAEDPTAPVVNFFLASAVAMKAETIELIGLVVTAASVVYLYNNTRRLVLRLRPVD
jgi:hypothetical protein